MSVRRELAMARRYLDYFHTTTEVETAVEYRAGAVQCLINALREFEEEGSA